MATTYIYRFIKSTWGIYVGLTAELHPYSNFEHPSFEVLPNFYLSIASVELSSLQEKYLLLGITLLKDVLQGWLKNKAPVVVQILELDITLTDYQPEGLTCALMGWLIKELGLTHAVPNPSFDKVKNSYIFDF